MSAGLRREPISQDEQPPAASGRKAAAAGVLSLDTEVSNSTDAVEGIFPVPLGGRLDPIGGKRKRYEDWLRVKALLSRMTAGVFLTLTTDRSKWTRFRIIERWYAMAAGDREKLGLTATEINTLPVEELAYRFQAIYVSRFLSHRLGFKVWVRVVEPQTRSGNGWMHWHCVVEVAGTRWDTGNRRKPIDLKGLANACWSVWRDDYEFGMVDVQLVKSHDRLASYLSKYITKAWPAIPRWVLESSRGVRLVGFAKAAGVIVRDVMGLPESSSDDDDGDDDGDEDKRKAKRAKRRPLIDRLTESGMSCNVIQRHGRCAWAGMIDAPLWALFELVPAVPGLRIVRRTWQTFKGQVEKMGLVWAGEWTRDGPRSAMNRVMTALERHGLLERIDLEKRRRREQMLDSWELMQWELEQGVCGAC